MSNLWLCSMAIVGSKKLSVVVHPMELRVGFPEYLIFNNAFTCGHFYFD